MAWKDFDANFEKDSNNDLRSIQDEEAVAQSLLNICMIEVRENLRDLLFGNDAVQFLDEYASDSSLGTIGEIINNAIKNYESRALVKGIETFSENDKVKVNITFGIDNTEEYDISFYVERTK